MIKDRGKTNICCYAWCLPLLTKSPGCSRGHNPCGIRGYFPFYYRVWMTSYPEEMGWEFGRFWKRFGCVLIMVWRSWGPTMALRSWVPTMVFRSWILTMQLTVDFGPCRQTIEFLPLGQRIEFSAIELSFSTVVAVVKFFGSWPAKMNWDLKHHEMCQTLGVVLA